MKMGADWSKKVVNKGFSENYGLLCARPAENVALTGNNRSSIVGRLRKSQRKPVMIVSHL